jgi:hypothetical protein
MKPIKSPPPKSKASMKYSPRVFSRLQKDLNKGKTRQGAMKKEKNIQTIEPLTAEIERLKRLMQSKLLLHKVMSKSLGKMSLRPAIRPKSSYTLLHC